LILALLSGLLAFQGQKKKPPVLPPLPGQSTPKNAPVTPPAKVPQGRPAGLPFENEVKGKDLVQRFVDPNPLLGVWQVTRMLRPQARGARGGGFIIFTKTFMSMHLLQPAAALGAPPQFQSSVRGYRTQGLNLVTTSRLGFRNHPTQRGNIFIEQGGLAEIRRFLFVGKNMLRIFQTPQTYIELRKVEDL